MENPYESGLDRNAANYQPLTPITFLERAAAAFPAHTAIIHGTQKTSYREFWLRSLRLASALDRLGIGKGDTVTVMLSNTPADAGGAFRRADGPARCCIRSIPASMPRSSPFSSTMPNRRSSSSTGNFPPS